MQCLLRLHPALRMLRMLTELFRCAFCCWIRLVSGQHRLQPRGEPVDINSSHLTTQKFGTVPLSKSTTSWKIYRIRHWWVPQCECVLTVVHSSTSSFI